MQEIGSVGVALHDAEGRPRAGLAVSGPSHGKARRVPLNVVGRADTQKPSLIRLSPAEATTKRTPPR